MPRISSAFLLSLGDIPLPPHVLGMLKDLDGVPTCGDVIAVTKVIYLDETRVDGLIYGVEPRDFGMQAYLVIIIARCTNPNSDKI